MSVSGNHVVAEGVSKAYGKDVVLRDLRLLVRAGECVALIGPSGCGKSTLLHCLSGLVPPDEGHVFLAETDLTLLRERELTAFRQQNFGFIFQFPTLLADLTTVENAALPLLLQGTRRRKALKTAEEWLQAFGIGDTASRMPSSLSGGEQQRVGVARALITEPAVVFADEPTGALDGENADRVLDLMLTAAREKKTTIVLVTHDPLIAKVCDRTMVMSNGRLRAEDAA